MSDTMVRAACIGERMAIVSYLRREAAWLKNTVSPDGRPRALEEAADRVEAGQHWEPARKDGER